MTENKIQAWECVVCGLVHNGPQPPDSCPVCGASGEEFKPLHDGAPASAGSAPNPPTMSWRCLECGYIHIGPCPPDECPVCGASADQFEPVQESRTQIPATSEAARVVILGAGIAGIAAAESIRTASPTTEIALISDEAGLPYQRLNLTRYLAGEITEADLAIHPANWYEQRNIRLLSGGKVKRIDLDEQALLFNDGQKVPFDKLVLTAGARAAVPPIPGTATERVLCLRTLDDAKAILDLAKPDSRCVCIGGGILGLEAAGALARRGVEVAVIENHGWLLPRQLNEKAARILEKHVMGLGIMLHHRTGVAEITDHDHTRRVRLQNGKILETDFVILATGIRPNIELAQRCGLSVNRGVLVNDRLETTKSNVLAAGDVAEHRGTVYGLWTASQVQGNIAGLNAVGLNVAFEGMPRSNFLKVLGVDLFSIGTIEADGAGANVVDQETDGGYLRFVFRDGCLVGAIVLGDIRTATSVKSAVERAVDLGDLLRKNPTATDIIATLASKSTT